MNLTHLSLQRVGRYQMPQAPTNEERLRAFRDAMPVRLHNGFPWPHTQRLDPAHEPITGSYADQSHGG